MPHAEYRGERVASMRGVVEGQYSTASGSGRGYPTSGERDAFSMSKSGRDSRAEYGDNQAGYRNAPGQPWAGRNDASGDQQEYEGRTAWDDRRMADRQAGTQVASCAFEGEFA